MGWRDTIQDAPKEDAPVAKSWRDTIQNQPAPPSALSKFIPSGDATPGENLEAGLNTIQSLGSDAANGINAAAEAINPLAPIAHGAANLARLGANRLAGGDKSYGDFVDEDNANAEKAKADSPLATQIGGIAGSLANPVNKLGVGASVLGSATNSALKNSLQNQNIDTIHDTGSNAGNLAENALIEGVGGKALEGLGGVGSKLLDSDWYRKKAVESLVKGSFKPTTKMAEKELSSGVLSKAAEATLDSGAVSPIQSREDLYKAILAKKQSTGSELGDILDSGGSVDKRKFAGQLQQQSADATLSRNPELAKSLEGESKLFREGGGEELSAKDIRDRRSKIDKLANAGMGDPTLKATANVLREQEESMIHPGLQGAYEDVKDTYKNLSNAETVSRRAAAIDSKGGTNTPGGGTSWVDLVKRTANPVTKYLPQLKAYGFNEASKVLENQGWAKTLGDAAEKGGASGVATAHYLLTQRDPAYRQAHQEDSSAERDK